MNADTSISENEYGTGSNIVIGGNVLGRGVTFPKLQTLYYTRTAKKPQADTMWQHSRMFGYDRDPGLMEVYLTQSLYKIFSDINAGKHHIFPKNYLTQIGYDSDRDRNQIANFTYLDYATNITISDKAPSDYVADFRAKLGENEYQITCENHALPLNFEELKYEDFLEQRRTLMAKIVKKAFKELCKEL